MLVTWVDWVFVAVLAVAVAAGFVRGLVREALGLASWIVALLAARMFAEPVAEVLGNWIDSPDGRLIVAFILIIVITILLGGILIRMIQAAVEWAGAGFLNRLTGALFGGVKAAAVLTLVTLLIGFTPLDQLTAWQDASVRPHFEQLRDWGLGQLSDFEGSLPDFPESLRELPQAEPSPPTGGEAEGSAIDDAKQGATSTL
ncbi:MAG: CvpA family protein [Gammaproteobacteria bacterium]|uniref:CvpA family protein n=1 Tax=Halomonas sp. EF61 TaxID=2950869 RepID=UPI0032DE85F0|nr:CvpA family protein [Gammaproteobacteria bacterium]